jgi:DNA-3-methyladenine glycosylase II
LYDRPAVTPADYARARRVLLRGDAVLAALIKRHGPCGLAAAQRTDHFSALVRAITNQQLSTKAAATIYRRLALLMPRETPTPEGLARLSDDQLREAGYSRQKIAYLRDLSVHVLDGRLDLSTIEDLPDDGVIAALTNVKGIGRWSADMFLMFRLHRPDVLPVGDLGIVTAIRTQYRLRKVPTPERIRRIGEAWKPYRSVACWYLWRSLDNQP